jgi:hypothetical protein
LLDQVIPPQRVDPVAAIKNIQISALIRPQRYKMHPTDGQWDIIRLGEDGQEIVGTMHDRELAGTVATALDDEYYEDQLPRELPSNVSMYMVFEPTWQSPGQYHGDWRDHVPGPIRENWLNLSWSAKRAVLWMAHLKHLEDKARMAILPPAAFDKET